MSCTENSSVVRIVCTFGFSEVVSDLRLRRSTNFGSLLSPCCHRAFWERVHCSWHTRLPDTDLTHRMQKGKEELGQRALLTNGRFSPSILSATWISFPEKRIGPMGVQKIGKALKCTKKTFLTTFLDRQRLGIAKCSHSTDLCPAYCQNSKQAQKPPDCAKEFGES